LPAVFARWVRKDRFAVILSRFESTVFTVRSSGQNAVFFFPIFIGQQGWLHFDPYFNFSGNGK
jgi:hypothetical protein